MGLLKTAKLNCSLKSQMLISRCEPHARGSLRHNQSRSDAAILFLHETARGARNAQTPPYRPYVCWGGGLVVEAHAQLRARCITFTKFVMSPEAKNCYSYAENKANKLCNISSPNPCSLTMFLFCVPQVTVTDGGLYTCFVNNTSGSDTVDTELLVYGTCPTKTIDVLPK